MWTMNLYWDYSLWGQSICKWNHCFICLTQLLWCWLHTNKLFFLPMVQGSKGPSRQGKGFWSYNYYNSCFLRLLIVNPLKHGLIMLQWKFVDTDHWAATLRGPHQPGGLRGSLCGAQGLSACGDQNCDQTRGHDRDGGASPVCCRHAVPPHLSPGWASPSRCPPLRGWQGWESLCHSLWWVCCRVCREVQHFIRHCRWSCGLTTTWAHFTTTPS